MRARTYAQSATSVVLLVAAVLFALRSAVAAAPSWWTTRGVLDASANRVTNDYAPATMGQLKWMAVQAAEELAAHGPAGAGSNLAALVSGLANTNNFSPATLGQAKAVAQLVYDSLGTTNYPWSATTADDNDLAPLLLGQLKNLFAFDLDPDADGLPDWWEEQWWGNAAAHTGSEDSDADGFTNLQEFQAGTNPTVFNRAPVIAITYPADGGVWP